MGCEKPSTGLSDCLKRAAALKRPSKCCLSLETRFIMLYMFDIRVVVVMISLHVGWYHPKVAWISVTSLHPPQRRTYFMNLDLNSCCHFSRQFMAVPYFAHPRPASVLRFFSAAHVSSFEFRARQGSRKPGSLGGAFGGRTTRVVCHGPTPETWVNQKTSRPTVRIRIIQLQEIPEKLKFENQPQWWNMVKSTVAARLET